MKTNFEYNRFFFFFSTTAIKTAAFAYDENVMWRYLVANSSGRNAGIIVQYLNSQSTRQISEFVTIPKINTGKTRFKNNKSF